MKKILLLDGALNTSNSSYSTQALNYVQTLFNNQEYEVQRINLNQTKFASTIVSRQNSKNFWQDVESDKWIEQLKQTDLLVISTSMINFGPTTTLKSFIDAIAVANKTFSYKYSTTNDAIGYLTNLNVLIIGSQGANFGVYPWGDHIKWLKGTFNFLGVKNIYSFDILGTKMSEIAQKTPSEYVDSVKDQIDKLVLEVKNNL